MCLLQSSRILVVAIGAVCALVDVVGQEPEHSLPEPKPLMTIRALRATLKALGEERDGKLEELRKAETPDKKEEFALQIRGLNGKIAELSLDLESVSTGVDVKFLDEKLGEGIELETELRELVQPMVQELKRATAKPRELEDLRSTVAYHKKRKEMASKALTHLRALIARSHDAEIKTGLQEMEKTWVAREDQFAVALATSEYQQAELDESDDSLLASLKQGASIFFRTRGLNILIAAGFMIVVFFVLRLIHNLVRRMKLIRRRGSFTVRLLDVSYYGVNLLLTVMAGVLAFYALGDWMMLGFTVIFLAGIAWTSKTALPQVYEQIKLMLNLGSVREGERVIYRGVPWEIRRISVYTELRNSSLEGGHLRLPLRDLIPLSSRPFEPKEPFFPCEKGDWVVLADSTVAKVIRQTPEWVQLVLLGSSVKTYMISDFLSQTPRNLLRGFRLSGKFGIDYAHQSIATTEVPIRLQEKLAKGLSNLVGTDKVVSVRVEFSSAGDSSLNYALLADFSGDAAERYFQLERAIQRICVDACNEYGWVIPFTQITLHQADGGGTVLPQSTESE